MCSGAVCREWMGVYLRDQEGRLWCVTDTWEVGTIADGVFKCLGHLGNEFIVDIAFHPVDGALWAVNRLVSGGEADCREGSPGGPPQQPSLSP